MDWLPFLLTFTCGSFIVPMLISFQRLMGELDKRIRAGEAQVRECEANIKKFVEEEGRVKQEIEKAKAALAEADKEKEEQEKKFQELKKQLMSDDDHE